MNHILAAVRLWWGELISDGTRLIWVVIQLAMIFLAAKVLAKITQGWIKKSFSRRADTNPRANTLGTITASTVRYIIYFIAITWVLSVLGLSATASSMVAGAGLGGLIIGLGAQDLFKDILNGFFLLFEDQFSVGETIRIADITARVESVSLRTTVLRSYDGVIHIIPNRSISQISNLSRDSSMIMVEMRIAHGQDIKAAMGVMQRAGEQVMAQAEVDFELIEPITATGPLQVDEWGVTLRVSGRTPPLMHYGLERDIRLACIQALEGAGYTLARTTLAQ